MKVKFAEFKCYIDQNLQNCYKKEKKYLFS